MSKASAQLTVCILIRVALTTVALTTSALTTSALAQNASHTPVSSTQIKDAKTGTITVCTRYSAPEKTKLEVYCGTLKTVFKR